MMLSPVRPAGAVTGALLALLCLSVAEAEPLRLAPLFCDHAVLQREKPVPVWGWTEPGQKVEVTFHQQASNAVADSNGRWQAMLPAMPASADSSDLTVTSGSETVTIHDVLVGEVWLCSGQSNMAWPVGKVDNAAQEIASANYPLIRDFRVPLVISAKPLDTFASRDGWTVTSPAKVALYSGVGYFFVRELYHKLNVPIGLINTSWGGKIIEVFMSQEAIAGDPNAAAIEKRWEQEQAATPALMAAYRARQVTPPADPQVNASGEEGSASKAKKMPGMSPEETTAQHRPSCIFNAMMNPVIPYGIRGIIWYQGEQNIARAGEYRSLFSSLITDWRKKFGQGDIPFYFAQLSTFQATMDKTRFGFAELREAQLETLSLPQTALAVTIDVGLPGATGIHPTDKQDVGLRLARIAEANVYHLDGEWSGPLFQSATLEKSAVRLSFDHVANGLVLKNNAAGSSFELAGSDGKYVPADARIDGKSIVVDSPSVTNPASVRYAWADAPIATLFNTEGLPASPFRTKLSAR